MSDIYDIIIVGAGPAGLTAAVYARRAGKSVLVIEKSTFGGQITFSPKIENFPGFAALSGNELADKLVGQALGLGADIELDCVTGLECGGEIKKVITVEKEYECRSVIFAAGARHRMLGIENESKYVGEGISFCAVCDGAFYKNGNVAVAGGGNSALQEAILLSDVCKSVTVLQNLAFLTGEKKLIDVLSAKKNVKVLYNTVVTALKGEKTLNAVEIKNTETGEASELETDALFIAVGLVPATKGFEKVFTLDKNGAIISDEECLTEYNGVFAAGDCRTKKIRQITTAAADGAVAALAACAYIDGR